MGADGRGQRFWLATRRDAGRICLNICPCNKDTFWSKCLHAKATSGFAGEVGRGGPAADVRGGSEFSVQSPVFTLRFLPPLLNSVFICSSIECHRLSPTMSRVRSHKIPKITA